MTDDDRYLRIGPFSRASWLSVRALRAYHESGLLVPAAVDPQTGYRSYSVDQLTDAAVIRRLRQLEVPLDAIRTVLDARDPEITRKVLRDHGAVMETRLESMQRTIDDLYAAVGAPSLHTPVHRRHEPSRPVLTVGATVSEDEWSPFLADARELLLAAVARTGAVPIGHAFGATYPPPLDDGQEVLAFVAVAEAPLLDARSRAAGVRVAELPATEVAVAAHHGSYDDLEDAYRNLGAWVGAHAVPSDLPVRELYLVGPAESDHPDEYRTQICWPVRDEEEEH